MEEVCCKPSIALRVWVASYSAQRSASESSVSEEAAEPEPSASLIRARISSFWRERCSRWVFLLSAIRPF